MLKSQRHIEIIEILKSENFATVTTLAKKVYASLPTIRRDLAFLESQGYIKRCHGGAVILNENANPPIYFRQEKNTKEKISICKAARTLISESNTIFLDASTTAIHIADFIDKSLDVTVITNSIPTLERFSEVGCRVFSTGGKLIKDCRAFSGNAAENAIRNYNADIFFFSASSISSSGMISDWSEDEVGIRKTMAECARTSVLLCDFSKIGSTSMFNILHISAIDYIITDKPLTKELTDAYCVELVPTAVAYLYKVKK